jgi:uncharacterized protein (TIGR03437 family)
MAMAGLGSVNPALAAGKAPPGSPLSNTVFAVTAEIDGRSAGVSFAGAAPGFPGPYQVNMQVPPSAGSGALPLVLFAADQPGQLGVTIFVQ